MMDLKFRLGILALMSFLIACSNSEPEKPKKRFAEPQKETVVKPKEEQKFPEQPKGPVQVSPSENGESGYFTFTYQGKSVEIFIPFGYDPQIQSTNLKDVDGNTTFDLWVTIAYTEPIENRKFLIYKDAFKVEGTPRLILGLDFQRKGENACDFRADYSPSAKAFVVTGKLNGDDGQRMVQYKWMEDQQRFVPQNARRYSRISMEEVGNDGISEFHYCMVDRLGNPFPMEDYELEPENMDHFTTVSRDGSRLITHDDGDIYLLELTTQKKRSMGKMPESLEGYSAALWAPGNEKVAFVGVNQGEFSEGAKVYVIELDKKAIRDFDVPVHFECGGICSSEPGKDFWWDTSDRIRYRIHEMKEDRRAPSDVIQL